MAEWLYAPGGVVVHAVHPGMAAAECGSTCLPASDWHGTGTHAERVQALRLRPCEACVATGAAPQAGRRKSATAITDIELDRLYDARDIAITTAAAALADLARRDRVLAAGLQRAYDTALTKAGLDATDLHIEASAKYVITMPQETP